MPQHVMRASLFKPRSNFRLGSRSRYHVAATPSRPEGLNAILQHTALQARETPLDGTLAGRHIAIKDNIATKAELPTSASSNILTKYTSPFSATVVELLEKHGANISSKTNLDEFGMGSHSQSSASGPVLSPFSRNGVPLSPGGSSGGSAVAVATGECWAALGTDTGGSVRLPAAYTDVVGFKPSYGLLSRWGVIQYANSLDTVGILSKKTADARQIFKALNHYDQKDPTSLSPAVRNRIASNKTRRAKSLRIGIPLSYNIAELSPSVLSTWKHTLQRLRSAGCTLHPVDLPSTRLALSTYYVLAPAEASSNLAKYDGVRYGRRTPESADASPKENLPLYARTRGEGFGEETKRRILLGAYTLSSEAMDNYFIQAQKVRRTVQDEFNGVFASSNPLLEDDVDGKKAIVEDVQEQVDIILSPTAPTLPPTVEEVKKLTPVESYKNDVFTVPASLAGLPAISIPFVLPEDIRKTLDETDVKSVGIQVVGQFGDDDLVLRVGEMLEQIEMHT